MEKLGDVRVAEGEAVGRWLGVVSRAVMGAVKEEEEEREGESGRGGEEGDDVDVGDWNVVQNNGRLAIATTESRLRGGGGGGGGWEIWWLTFTIDL